MAVGQLRLHGHRLYMQCFYVKYCCLYFLYFNVSLLYLLKQTNKPKNPPASTAFTKATVNAANTPNLTDEYGSHFEMKNFLFSKYTAL